MNALSLDLAGAAELMYETGWTDGLPVVPPTKERVADFVAYLRRPPDELIGEIPPLGGKATVERLAVNAVMAGCLPEYMPVVVTAIQAMLEDRFNLRGSPVFNRHTLPLNNRKRPRRQATRHQLGVQLLRPGMAGQCHHRARCQIGVGQPGWSHPRRD